MMEKKQATIKDIARKLGISYSTVSRALSHDRKVSALVAEKTRKQVQQKAAELDYSPNLMAQGFVTGKTGALGLLTYEISRQLYGSQAEHILRAANTHNYQIMISTAIRRQDNLIQQIKQLISRGIDGLLIHTRGNEGESERILNAVRGQVPVVSFHHPNQMGGVVLDETTSFCEATEHLIRLGHERIGFVGVDWNRTVVGSAKGKGYLMAMRKHSLTPERIAGKTGLLEPAYQLGKEIGDRFTALVCRNDYTALGVCRGLREAGIRVPEDVAVVGNGDLDVAAYVTPALTTLATPYEAITQAAMELMLEQLGGGQEPRQITVKSSLIVRESCGANIRT